MGISPTRPALARNRTPYDIDSSRVDGTMEVDRRPVEQVPVCKPTRRGLAPAVHSQVSRNSVRNRAQRQTGHAWCECGTRTKRVQYAVGHGCALSSLTPG